MPQPFVQMVHIPIPVGTAKYKPPSLKMSHKVTGWNQNNSRIIDYFLLVSVHINLIKHLTVSPEIS